MIADAIARYLHDNGLVRYDADQIEGDCFLFVVPDAPAVAVTLTPAGGDVPVVNWPWDDSSLQVRVRGEPRRHLTAFARAYVIYSRLHGLASTMLPGGVWLIRASSTSSGPVYMGSDSKSRPEFVLNFELAVEAPTVHRP